MILQLLTLETDLIATACVSFKNRIVLTCVLVAVFAAVLAVALIGIIKYILTSKKVKESELRIDDEIYMLEALSEAISASDDIESVRSFFSCSDALAYVEENPVDIAFLDINMRGMRVTRSL